MEVRLAPRSGGDVITLTDYNAATSGETRIVTSDFDWSPDGSQLTVYYATTQAGQIVEQSLDLLTLDRSL